MLVALILVQTAVAVATAVPAASPSPSPSPSPALATRPPSAARTPQPTDLGGAAKGRRIDPRVLRGFTPRPGPSPAPGAADGGKLPDLGPGTVVVESVSDEGVNEAWEVPVTGTVKNRGPGAACAVRVAVTVFDDVDGTVLGVTEALAGRAKLEPGERSSFRAAVRVPAGTGPPQSFWLGKSAMKPDFPHSQGRTEAKVVEVSSCTPPGSPAPVP